MTGSRTRGKRHLPKKSCPSGRGACLTSGPWKTTGNQPMREPGSPLRHCVITIDAGPPANAQTINIPASSASLRHLRLRHRYQAKRRSTEHSLLLCHPVRRQTKIERADHRHSCVICVICVIAFDTKPSASGGPRAGGAPSAAPQPATSATHRSTAACSAWTAPLRRDFPIHCLFLDGDSRRANLECCPAGKHGA
jgi:hypothetical protein